MGIIINGLIKGGDSLNPGSEEKLSKALNQLKKAKQDIEAFAMETQDKNSQKLYQDGAKQIEQVLNSVSGRANYVENQNDKEASDNLDLE